MTHVPNGSLIFSEIDKSPKGIVERTQYKWSGNLNHVAITLDGFVYEATWPKVKQTPLREWIVNYDYERGRHSFFIMVPKKSLSQNQLDKMRNYANSELGRKYEARGLWQDRETKGTFCSKYVSEILEQGNIIKSIRHRETPQSLYLEIGDLYNFLGHYKR